MAQHHSRSKAARDIGLPDIIRMTKEEACKQWLTARHGSLENVPCPGCGDIGRHYLRLDRENLRCRNIECRTEFSLFTDTPFYQTKFTAQMVLLGLLLFIAAAQGISANELARLLCVDYKTAFLFLGKVREAIMCMHDRPMLSGVIEIDGGHFGGKPRKPCRRRKHSASAIGIRAREKFGADRDKRAHPQAPTSANERRNAAKRMNRRVAIVIRECNGVVGAGAGRSVIAVCKSENAKDVTELVKRFVQPGSTIRSDENNAYDWLSLPDSGYHHERVNHSIELSTLDGINENQAESAFSRIRRAEYGTTHRVTPLYFSDYAWEYIWRENVRKLSAKTKLIALIQLIGSAGLSRSWRCYYQGNRRRKEVLLDHVPARLEKTSHLLT
jgi:hypothetical protein